MKKKPSVFYIFIIFVCISCGFESKKGGQFQSFSEHASAALGLTSVQYQALLAIETQQNGVPLTVKLLAQQLMIKHNSAVGLVDRIEQLGLAARWQSESDRRSVVVALTPRGLRAVNRLAVQHRRALQAIAPEMGRDSG